MSLCVFFGSIVLLIAFNLAYDVVVIMKYGPNASISRAMMAFKHICPVGPCLIVGIALLLIGVLIGHFWWPN
jgi:hypothetical protein